MDGDLDAVIANYYQAYVWVNDGTGGFDPHPINHNLNEVYNYDTVLGDLDSDGDLDLIFARHEGGPDAVWMNDGSGNFSYFTSFGSGSSRGIALGDIDNDGDLDAVVAQDASDKTWINDGSGNYTPHSTTPSFGTGQSWELALGDLNNDGHLDVVISKDGPETTWLNNGAGSFTPHPTAPSFGGGNSRGLALSDMDGDGDLDVVITNNTDEVQTIWLNNGSGAFSPHPLVPKFDAASQFSKAVGLGDIDGNGSLDAIIAKTEGRQTVWLNLMLRTYLPIILR